MSGRNGVHFTNAHVAALDYLAAGGESTALNLGTGHGHSVHEIIAAVERIMDRPVPYRAIGRRPGDPPKLVADPARARERLRWQPRCSDLDTIIKTALAWEQADRNRIGGGPWESR